MNKLSLMIAAFFVASVATAEPYSYEASIDHTQSETDFVETKSTTLSGTYYWKPVAAKDVPFAEAAFVSRASSLSFGFDHRSFDEDFSFIAQPLNVGNFDTSSLDIFTSPPVGAAVLLSPSPNLTSIAGPGASASNDTNVWSGSARYVAPNGWLGKLGLSLSSDDNSVSTNTSEFTSDAEMTRLTLGVGKYIGPATTVVFEYGDRSAEFDTMSTFSPTTVSFPFPAVIIAPPSRSSQDSSERSFSLVARTLISHGNYSHSLSALVGYDVLKFDSIFEFDNPNFQPAPFSDKSYALRTGFDYTFYPRRDVGLGLGYTVIDSEFEENKALTLYAEWFVTPKVALKARYLSTDAPGPYSDSDGVGAGITGRF